LFFLFEHHLDCPGSGSVFPIRIRIQGSHFNTEPHGSGSGSETRVALIKKRKVLDFWYYRSWRELLHLAIFDLSLKHERKQHALERDLLPALLDCWPLYQLPRSFNTLLQAGLASPKCLSVILQTHTTPSFSRKFAEHLIKFKLQEKCKSSSSFC